MLRPFARSLKPRANGRNIVGQQLPILLDVTCCVRSHTLLHVVGSCCIRLDTTANTDATTPNIVSPTMLGVVASACIPLPTRTQQLPTLLARQFWELLRLFGHHCQQARNNSQHCWPDNVGSCCVRLHVAYGVFPGHHFHVFRWHIRWDHVTRNARSHTKTPNLSCLSATVGEFSSLKRKKTQVPTPLSSSNSMSFHDLFKFSMKLDLVVTLKNFHIFLVWGYFLTLSSSTDTNSDVHQNVCHLRCLITPIYLSLSLLCHLQ